MIIGLREGLEREMWRVVGSCVLPREWSEREIGKIVFASGALGGFYGGFRVHGTRAILFTAAGRVDAF